MLTTKSHGALPYEDISVQHKFKVMKVNCFYNTRVMAKTFTAVLLKIVLKYKIFSIAVSVAFNKVLLNL